MKYKEIRPCVYITYDGGFLDLYNFRNSKIYKKLFSTVLEHCYKFTLTSDLQQYDIIKRTGGRYSIPADCSAELIVRIIKLNAMSDCAVCRYRDGYCGCTHHKYGQNWSFGTVGDCGGFTLEYNTLSAETVKKECTDEFKKFLELKKAAHKCMCLTGTTWGGDTIYTGVFDGKMYRGVFNYVFYKILSLLIEKEWIEVE